MIAAGTVIRHTIIARTFFCLENDTHSKACNDTNIITPALHRNILGVLFTRRTRLMRHQHLGNYKSWITRQNVFWGIDFGRKGTQNTQYLNKNI